VCQVSQQTIIRCFDSGRIRGFRVPGSKFRRIPREALLQFMRDNGIPLDRLATGKSKVLIVDDDKEIVDIFADALKLNVTSIAFAGLGVLLMMRVLTLTDIATQGDTLSTFLWLAVLFALSGQLNELGFMGYAGQLLAAQLGGLSWPVTYVLLVVIYVAIHYMFVSQSSQVLALLGVFLDVGIRGGVPAPLMAFALLFASSYFSVITPQGGSQNVIFVGAGYLTQRELYLLGLLMTLFFLGTFLTVGTAWILLVT
jgi:DASS family divalent anion:Na+ symporter